MDLDFTIEEDLLFLVLDDEGRFANGGAVVLTAVRLHLLLVSLLIISSLSIGLTIEDHLLPRFELFEEVQDVLVHWIVYLTWAHECAILQTVVLKHALVGFRDSEGLETTLVFKF